MVNLSILHLYPDTLRLNGEQGNVTALKVRAQEFGAKAKVVGIEVGQALPKTRPSIIFIGSGTTSATLHVISDLRLKDAQIHRWIAQGTKVLAVGTGFDLVSQSLELPSGEVVLGLGLTNTTHRITEQHLVGEVVVTGDLAGFINTDREIIRIDKAQALGKVSASDTRDLVDYEDGYRDGKVWCSNLQGPLLPMNPKLADEILSAAGVTGKMTSRLKTLNSLATKARKAISSRVLS